MSLKEFAEKSLLKPWDVFIIFLLTVLSFLPVMNQNIPFDGWRKELHIYLQR